MNKKYLLLCLLLGLVGCETVPIQTVSTEPDYNKLTHNNKYAKLLIAAEKKAPPAARKVLETGRKMALLEQKIIKGGCWDYVNAVYEKAGFPIKGKRTVLLNVKKNAKANFSLKDLQPGDFLSYINHSYHNSEHSAIFVDWMDKEKNLALMLSYAGENRQEPARYRPYDVSDVFYIARATLPKPVVLPAKKQDDEPVEAESEIETD
jgi:hypothetical protein